MSPKDEETDGVPPVRRGPRPLDAADRRILSALVADAGQSYAALGRAVGLSAPAAHDRVKRLRAAGRIHGVSARIDPDAVGKPLLAFVEVDTRGWGKSQAVMTLTELPEVEEMHSVTGDACLILKVRCADSRALEGLLARLYATPGVVKTRSRIALNTYLERGVQAEVTADLPDTPAPDALPPAHDRSDSNR